MTRQVYVVVAALLAVVDAGIHLRRSLIPDGNPFGTSLHRQFSLFTCVAVLLVVALFFAPRWLRNRAWLVSAALMVWELGAIAVWLLAYHAPNPNGLVPGEGYLSKILEALVILVLVPTLRMPRPARSLAATG